MRRALAVVLAIGCGSSDPPAGGDAPTGDEDAAIDDPGSTCPAGQWCMETSPVAATLLHGVIAVAANDVFAIGDGGTILRRRNNAWTQMQSNTTANLRGIWAASATDIWAVGEGGTIMRYDGAAWSAQAGVAESIDLNAVWGASSDDVYVAGTATVFHWNGSTFTPKSVPGEPLAISGTGPSDVWVTGESAKVDHFTGTWTTGIDPGAGSTYFAIAALAPNAVWIATFTPGKETLRFDGQTWTPHAAAGTSFQSFHVIGADDIWAAGGSKVGHWNGSAWTTESPLGGAAQYWSAHGVGSSVWVVGSDSVILHRN